MRIRAISPALARLAGLAALAIVLLAPIGCETYSSKEPFSYDEAGTPQTSKRIEKDMEFDLWHHWTRTVYRAPKADMKAPADSSQEIVLEQFGQPDWIRKFRSFQNEKVEEWLYMSQGILFQFVGGERVFDGPVLDMEQTLLTRGHPDEVELFRSDQNERNARFVYSHIFSQNVEQFNFINDKLIASIEGQ